MLQKCKNTTSILSAFLLVKFSVVFNTSLKLYNMLAEDVCALSIINLSQAHTLAYGM